MSPSSAKTVRIELTSDEALVLFEFLRRFSDSEVIATEDQAEQRVLWNLCCVLEKVLMEPFSESYPELVAEARNRLRDEDT